MEIWQGECLWTYGRTEVTQNGTTEIILRRSLCVLPKQQETWLEQSLWAFRYKANLTTLIIDSSRAIQLSNCSLSSSRKKRTSSKQKPLSTPSKTKANPTKNGIDFPFAARCWKDGYFSRLESHIVYCYDNKLGFGSTTRNRTTSILLDGRCHSKTRTTRQE